MPALKLVPYCRPTACVGETALPLTMELARLLKLDVAGPQGWHANDRLVWALEPSLRGEVEAFYRKEGDGLVDNHSREEVAAFDQRCLQALLGWVRESAPRLYTAVIAVSEA